MRAVLTAFLSIMAVSAAWAQEGSEEGGPSDESDGQLDSTDEAAAEGKKKKKSKKEETKEEKEARKAEERRTGDTIDVTGRVYTRMTMSSEDDAPWQSDLELQSARIGFDYQWREKFRVEVSYEAARDSIRDAFIELQLGHGLRLRAGRMKVPVSMIERTSSWTLPVVGRGMVADILNDGIVLTGRRTAAVLRWRGTSAMQPTIEVAAQQQTNLAGDEITGVVSDGAGVNVYGRVEVSSPCRMYTFAIGGANRAVAVGEDLKRYSSVAAEIEVDLEAIESGLRAWGDVVYGQSHLAAVALGEVKTRYLGAHAVIGYRLGGLDRNEVYVEPFVGAGWFDPTTSADRDEVAEVRGGLSGGIWKRWRAQAQLTYRNAKSARPPLLLGDLDVNDGLAFSAQLGAAF